MIRAVLGLTTLLLMSPLNAGAAETYHVDVSRSSVMFKVSQFGMPLVRGYFKRFAGSFSLEKEALEQFAGTVQMESLSTGNKRRDGDLKAESFFGASKFPVMSIQSQSINQSGGQVTVQSDLTIRDRTKPIVLKGQLTRDNGEAVLALQGRINRQDYGLRLNKIFEFFVGNDVQIVLRFSAVEGKAPGD